MTNRKRWSKRLLRGIGALAGVLLLTWGGLYLYTERALHGTDFPVNAVLPKGDSLSGERLARIQGCSGCHGRQLEGQVELPLISWVARAVELAALSWPAPIQRNNVAFTLEQHRARRPR